MQQVFRIRPSARVPCIPTRVVVRVTTQHWGHLLCFQIQEAITLASARVRCIPNRLELRTQPLATVLERNYQMDPLLSLLRLTVYISERIPAATPTVNRTRSSSGPLPLERVRIRPLSETVVPTRHIFMARLKQVHSQL